MTNQEKTSAKTKLEKKNGESEKVEVAKTTQSTPPAVPGTTEK